MFSPMFRQSSALAAQIPLQPSEFRVQAHFQAHFEQQVHQMEVILLEIHVLWTLPPTLRALMVLYSIPLPLYGNDPFMATTLAWQQPMYGNDSCIAMTQCLRLSTNFIYSCQHCLHYVHHSFNMNSESFLFCLLEILRDWSVAQQTHCQRSSTISRQTSWGTDRLEAP